MSLGRNVMLAAPRSLILAMYAVCGIVLVTPERVHSQRRATTHCCTVVRIDIRRGIVMARETATGYTFGVEVKNKKHLAALRVGDKVWANFAVRKVRLEAAGDSLCCAILETPPQPDPPAPSIPYQHNRS
jgi:hypothetical protein